MTAGLSVTKGNIIEDNDPAVYEKRVDPKNVNGILIELSKKRMLLNHFLNEAALGVFKMCQDLFNIVV